jgi:glycosyltransferase involved in cell wall biosynthesis
MTAPAATVILPTTGDRGPVLRHSVASVLAQTIGDLELFIVGDGVSPETRDVITGLVAQDRRVRFVDRPKHERRGEPYRHEVLSEQASGAVVAYVCDRDLWLPTHLEELTRCLQGADLAHTLRFWVDDGDQYRFTHRTDLSGADRDRSVREPSGPQPSAHRLGLVPLSFAGHTLDAYRRLPHGWRVTPADTATDRYMWSQFLDQPWVGVAHSAIPTVLSFKRGDHPGLSTLERLAVLERWTPRLADSDGVDAVQREVVLALWQAWRAGEVRARAPRRRTWRSVPRSLRRRLGGR